MSVLHVDLKAVYTFLYRPYGTCCAGKPFFYRYYVPNGTKCKPTNEGCRYFVPIPKYHLRKALRASRRAFTFGK